MICCFLMARNIREVRSRLQAAEIAHVVEMESDVDCVFGYVPREVFRCVVCDISYFDDAVFPSIHASPDTIV